ncbi:MAG: acetyl-CoA carboxylase carboxyltransferase subunit alpha [Spirochaetes bacterium]|nr:acetyl-CoA carboxylase carboxyltransferase subunit alpha [Spirochaetota bacterium]
MILDFEKPINDLEKKLETVQKTYEKHPDPERKIEMKNLEKQIKRLKIEIHNHLTPWQRVQLARHPARPYFLDYVKLIFHNFIEIHGDRTFKDDKSVVTGWADLDNQSVMLIGQQKGRTVEENLMRNFGSMHPEGYRKALRVMKMAEKFSKPIITFIDTQGAYPGIGAEERGQAEAIARNLKEMSSLKVPVITVVIGEGGSGGALGIGVANKVLMLENSTYSVISPEGCASILWRDATRAPEAAKALKLTAQDLYYFGVIDLIIDEPLGGAHTDHLMTANSIKKEIKNTLAKLNKLSSKSLVSQRYHKYRTLGEYIEKNQIKTSRKKITKK